VAPSHRNDLNQNFNQARADSAEKKEIQKTLFSPDQLQLASEHPEKKHVDQQVKQAAVQKNVSERLPQAEARDGTEGDKTEEVVKPRGNFHAEEDIDERLDQENPGADQYEEFNAGSDKATPVEVVAAGAERSCHI
jgi:hypothetical protein